MDEPTPQEYAAALLAALERKAAGTLPVEDERDLGEVTVNLLRLMAKALGEAQDTSS